MLALKWCILIGSEFSQVGSSFHDHITLIAILYNIFCSDSFYFCVTVLRATVAWAGVVELEKHLFIYALIGHMRVIYKPMGQALRYPPLQSTSLLILNPLCKWAGTNLSIHLQIINYQ